MKTLGLLHNLTEALVSNLCPIASLMQLKDGPGVTHSVQFRGHRNEPDYMPIGQTYSPVGGHGSSNEAALSHTPPSSVLSSLQLGSSVLRECPKHSLLGSPGDGTGFSSTLSSPPSSAQGLWNPLETSAPLAREKLMQVHPISGGDLLCPSAPGTLSVAICMAAPLTIQALAQMSPPPRDHPDCPLRVISPCF